ncbi:MAG TPA: class II histone deacetylase, partial [Sulfitobacter sp.]|nr:class II histone deacetylase [Sulfitobacter sp.]
MTTGFFMDERCFWHAGGNYAFTMPVGGLVQPLAAGGLPENPETKRRLRNLMEVTGLMAELDLRSAAPASREDLLRVHPAAYLDDFKRLSDAGGGELGLRTPFAAGGFEIAALSAGLSIAAVEAVAKGDLDNAYALSRPPGHHALPDFPNGFCLLANIAIAIEAAKAKGLVRRVAVLDWDVHHGNGTEAIFYDRDDVLTISLHQEGNYPLDTGALADRGDGAGAGYNINLPMHAGSGHTAYLHALDRVVLPALDAYQPDMIIVACGFDASIVDPLARMQATAEIFAEMTQRIKAAAQKLCGGKLVLVHEGGYS